MATEQYFHQGLTNLDYKEAATPPRKSAVSTAIACDDANGCFDCNICLDSAHDPVVTLCGHLYCWPCIYKWLHFQDTSFDQEEKHQCPVCKAGISQTTLVPLYGRGQSSQMEPSGKDSLHDFSVPSRPRPCDIHSLVTSTTSTSRPSPHIHRRPYRYRSQAPRNQQYSDSFSASPALHPMIGMFGEMVYARVFGNSQAASLYWYPNAYHQMTTSPRVRRQEMQAEKSLNRISIFLFCCFVFCLLLF